MRAAVTALLSAPELDTTMNKPDYHQTLDVHRTLLVLLKPLGTRSISTLPIGLILTVDFDCRQTAQE
jgi:hypothetical protein